MSDWFYWINVAVETMSNECNERITSPLSWLACYFTYWSYTFIVPQNCGPQRAQRANHSYKVRKTYCTNVVVTGKWLTLLDWCITTMSNWWMTNWLAPKWWLSKVQKAKGYVCLDMTKFLTTPELANKSSRFQCLSRTRCTRTAFSFRVSMETRIAFF